MVSSRLMPVQRRITIKDVARVAGVHHTTVSMALRNHPSLPESTRNRIQGIARRMKYRPDPHIVALNAYRLQSTPAKFKSTIAFVTHFNTAERWKDFGIYRDFYEGCRERGRQMGFDLQNFWLGEPGMTPSRFSRILNYRGIPGLIIAPLPLGISQLKLDWSEFSVITAGYSLQKPDFHRVCHHHYQSIIMAVRQLRKLGYRRIGLAIPEKTDSRVGNNWSGGFHVAQQEIPSRERVPPWIVPNNLFNWEGFGQWIELNQPDVVISSSSKIPNYFKNLGLKCPNDIAWVFMERDATNISGIAGICQNWKKIGAIALDLIAGLIYRNEKGIPRTPVLSLVNGSWINGPTAPPRKSLLPR